jgi:hypothetical protein
MEGECVKQRPDAYRYFPEDGSKIRFKLDDLKFVSGGQTYRRMFEGNLELTANENKQLEALENLCKQNQITFKDPM